MFDYYSFVVEVRQGYMTSRSMYWLLVEGLGLNVQALEHTITAASGIHETQWQARVQATECPAVLRNKGYIVMGQTEIVIHHAAIHVNWPCRTCLFPDHPTRACTVAGSEVESEKTRRTCIVDNTTLPQLTDETRSYWTGGTPTTISQLETILRLGVKAGKADQRGGSTGAKLPPKKAASPTKKVIARSPIKLTLPAEWGQSKPLSEGSDGSADNDDKLGKEGEKDAETTVSPCSEKKCPPTGMTADQVEFGTGSEDQDMLDSEDMEPIPVSHISAVTAIKLEHQKEANNEPARGRRGSPKKTVSTGAARRPFRSDASKKRIAAMKKRRASTSPKRKADPRWLIGQEQGGPAEGEIGVQVTVPTIKARSVSPKRLRQNAERPREKMTMQKFMHEFLSGLTGKTAADVITTEDRATLCNLRAQESQELAPETGAATTGLSDSPMKEVGADHEWSVGEEERGFAVLEVTDPTDKGALLAQWMKTIGGTVVNVAANGHCGWLAFYAALYNIGEGLEKPAPTVVVHTNLLKKRVLNEMIANVADETKLHPEEMRAEALACGAQADTEMSDTEHGYTVAKHLAAQRAKSVKAAVPMNCWVRPMHLKAMAMHARETLYVLDVDDTDRARMQAYAYHNVLDRDGDELETGTVCPIPTVHAMALLADLVEAGIRPPVMILRWSQTGNHFQAVNYLHADHANYAKNIATLANARSKILEEHGWKSMDTIEYDPAKTAAYAAATLTRLRRRVTDLKEAAEREDQSAVTDLTASAKRDAGTTEMTTPSQDGSLAGHPQSTKNDRREGSSPEKGAAHNSLAATMAGQPKGLQDPGSDENDEG